MSVHKFPFQSFFLGGFECTYAKGPDKKRMDQLSQTKHDLYCRHDYRLLKSLGITTVREGLSWSQIDQKNQYDFTRFERILEIGVEEGIQQIWDLNHFDYPDYLDPFSDDFVDSFSKYAVQAVKVIRRYTTGTIYLVPLNEISYFSWIGAHVGRWAPYTINKGNQFKKQLVRATIAAIKAIKKVDPFTVFVHVDPLMRRIPNPRPKPEVLKVVKDFNKIKWEAWDMLSGKKYPSLGGNLKYMDVIGVNYYYFNQEWVLNRTDAQGNQACWGIGWNTPNRVSLASLLKEVYLRYGKPILITETGGWGEYRWKWWQRIIKEVHEALSMGLPILGICAYPAVDRHDWEKGHLTNSGLWDFAPNDPALKRIPHTKTLKVIKKAIPSFPSKISGLVSRLRPTSPVRL